jgi:hypothetical protein
VFVGLPDIVSRENIENSLAHRIPLWFEDKSEVIRQYVPEPANLIADTELLRIFLQKSPSVVVKAISEQARFA